MQHSSCFSFMTFLSVCLAALVCWQCKKTTEDLPTPDGDAIGDIRLENAKIQPLWNGKYALWFEAGLTPGQKHATGSIHLTVAQGSKVLADYAINTGETGIPSGDCCIPNQGACPAIESDVRGTWYITCDAYCDKTARNEGCNYHYSPKSYLILDAAPQLPISLTIESEMEEDDDPNRSNNQLTVYFEELPTIDNPDNPYDYLGRLHNQTLDYIAFYKTAELESAGTNEAARQTLFTELSRQYACENLSSGSFECMFPAELFMDQLTGSPEGLILGTSLQNMEQAANTQEMDPINREFIQNLFNILILNELPTLFIQQKIAALEATILDSGPAEQTYPSLTACAIARYSLSYWDHYPRQPGGPILLSADVALVDVAGGVVGAAVGGLFGGIAGGLLGAATGAATASATYGVLK